ncbi:MAG: CBS domain-containing protein [Candidatus Poribacteria bacterium]|nr:CBS domain-containing protein [Candidatus Poribacteria bacterium]
MIYEQVVEEEMAIMEAELDEPSKALSRHETQVPLSSLMHPPLMVEMGKSTQEATDLMIANDVGAVLVVSDRVLKGIFGERDVLLKILNKPVGDLTQIPVDRFMKENPQTSHVDDTLDSAILHMARGGYRHIPIVDDQNRPVGLVSIRHIISHLVEHFPQEVLTLPPKPIREAMKAREGA